MAKRICTLIAQGYVVPEIAEMPDMPAKGTIYGWLIDHPEFLAQYDVAKEKQMEVFGDSIIAIAKNCPADVDAVAKAKLLIHTIQWTMGKIKPKKYGDKTVIAGDKDAPLTLTALIEASVPQIVAPKTIDQVPSENVIDAIESQE